MITSSFDFLPCKMMVPYQKTYGIDPLFGIMAEIFWNKNVVEDGLSANIRDASMNLRGNQIVLV